MKTSYMSLSIKRSKATTLKMAFKTDFELIIVGHSEQANCDGSEENTELWIRLDLLDNDFTIAPCSDDDDSSIKSLESDFIGIDFPMHKTMLGASQW
jgi:hypothetical protein